ncbi:ATP-binding protein [Burkholderia glumae]|uniref:ATP-binding protein n=1 Tax=Burkholderia glumae TaxID=337 RepID=UPI0020CD2FBB|nr:ATP-binding protein [Burkholderia glumae]MCQ0034700.1 putative DNA binding domain-containing protein [Burkholderia glumae]MCQ0040371.1 putative DNA binding domain-containing protein [Burkholderia glumae]
MIQQRHPERLGSLVRELLALPTETEWVEFKRNNERPEDIGEYVSALSNSAALLDKAHGYLIWGIDDASHAIVGTEFDPRRAKVGNEELENWLLRLVSPKVPFQFLEVSIDERRVVLLEVGRAYRHPVQFQNNEFVRVGSYRKKLKEFPEKERALWRIFDETPFEALVAADGLSDEEVVGLLDYPAYFDLAEVPLPERRRQIVQRLEAEGLVTRNAAGTWDVTNLGAILFAKRLDDFPHLRRKAVRVIAYGDNSRINTLREQVGTKGYAAGFEGLIGFVNSLIPSNEVIGQALRRTVPMYPELAVRELVANALIHQDFAVGGAGPMIEIFADRMEISNPGAPLVDVDRFLDTPPRSRNEGLASLMRRFGICEERGSGVDKVVHETEFYQLPAPEFASVLESTRACLFAHRSLAQMDKRDRIRACYLHACLRYVSRDYMSNTSLRERFGIAPQNSAMASRYIKEAVEHGMIRPYDELAGRKYMKYVPHWA